MATCDGPRPGCRIHLFGYRRDHSRHPQRRWRSSFLIRIAPRRRHADPHRHVCALAESLALFQPDRCGQLQPTLPNWSRRQSRRDVGPAGHALYQLDSGRTRRDPGCGFPCAACRVLEGPSTSARYTSVATIQRCPAGFTHSQRASTMLSESHAVTFQAWDLIRSRANSNNDLPRAQFVPNMACNCGH
jgi:hypothetical protein